MTLEKLFEKYGHVEVFSVEDSMLKSYHDKGWEGLSYEEVEKTLWDMGEFIPRYRAEIDRGYRQVIPYCVLMCQDKIFATRRLDGDARLVGKYSIGIGGHIEKEDGKGASLIRQGLRRELDEEVDIGAQVEALEILGYIYMDESPVDSVHYGIAYGMHLDNFDVEVKEKDTLEGRWYTKPELNAFKDDLEDWSLYCIEHLL